MKPAPCPPIRTQNPPAVLNTSLGCFENFFFINVANITLAEPVSTLTKFHCGATKQKVLSSQKDFLPFTNPGYLLRYQIISLLLKNMPFPWQWFSSLIEINT